MSDNFYGLYTFPFEKSTFDDWFFDLKNHASVGRGHEIGASFTEYADSGTVIELSGKRYIVYKLRKRYSWTSVSPHFCFFATSDGCLPDYASRIRIKGPDDEPVVPNLEYKGEDSNWPQGFAYAIKLQYKPDNKAYFYIIAQEKAQTKASYAETARVEPVPASFEPLQEIAFETQPSITVAKTVYTFDSSSSNSGEPEEKTLYPSWDANYSSPGEKAAYVRFESGAKAFSISISISDWESIGYSIEPTGSLYSIYTGKQVGSDFLAAFRIRCVRSNSYGSETVYPKSALELSKMSKSVASESDAEFAFEYDISDITETSVTSVSKTIQSFHRLASGSGKFVAVSRKSSYEISENVEAIDLSHAGSLTYDDGTTISMEDVGIQTQKTTCSLGSLPLTITEGMPNMFNMTYEMETLYFGSLSFTDSCSVENPFEVGAVEFSGSKSDFLPNDVIAFGPTAELMVYDKDGLKRKDVLGQDIARYASHLDQRYGKKAGAYPVDGKQTLTFISYGVELSQDAYFTYDESILGIDTEQIAEKIVFDPTEGTPEFDYTGLKIYATRHGNGPEGTEIVRREIDLDDEGLSITHEGIDESEDREYSINVSYENEWGQRLTGRFVMEAAPLKAVGIVASGNPSSTEYFDNGVEVFKLPVGIDLTITFNDPTGNIEIEGASAADLSDFEFFRDSGLENALVAGTSVISRKDGNYIYVYSPRYKISGKMAVSWKADAVQSVSLANPITVFYGNRLNRQSVKSQVVINALRESGATSVISNPSDFNFSVTSVIFPETKPSKSECKIILNGLGSFEIENYDTYITWSKPLAALSLNLDAFQTDYSNNTDAIYPQYISAKVSYYEDAAFERKCEYEQECSYSESPTDSYEKFVAQGMGDLSAYVFGEKVDVDLQGEIEATESIRITANSRFYSSGAEATVSEDATIKIVEIGKITGIKLLWAKTDYSVGDSFLNESDDTRILVFFEDENNSQKTYECNLRGGLTGLNVYPIKGTKLNQIAQGIPVTVTSAYDSGVTAQYSIKVSPKYRYDDITSHNLVALFLDDYVCPDGVERSKYFLVERTVSQNGEAVESTKIEEDGSRAIADGLDREDLNVFGYLDDIGDEDKNARLILFKDYIPPVEGSNNVYVKFPCYVKGNSELINGCHFGIMFGNNNSKNRLFVSGNKENKNKDWHSGQADATHAEDASLLNGNYGYFEDLSECVYGETDNAVVGYDIVSNDKLLVLKDHSDKETTIYFRQPQLVTAINTGGTSVTGLDGETLYQEEFSLSKGNNSVAGVNPKAIVNFNGDSLFVSNDNQIVGLDLTGIVGDNQRYANTRSYYIDEDLRKADLSGALMWSDNKMLMVALESKIYVSAYETLHDGQYEWFPIDVANVSAIFKKGKAIYFGTNDGRILKTSDSYRDANKTFSGYGIVRLSANDKTELITGADALESISDGKEYMFRPVPIGDLEETESYIYYSLGTIRNDKAHDCDFYADNSDSQGKLELICHVNGQPDMERKSLILKMISETEPVFVGRIDTTDGAIACKPGSAFEQAHGKKYFFKECDDAGSKSLYRLVDENGNPMPCDELYRARLCMRLDHEAKMVDIDKENGTFGLSLEGAALDIVQYGPQSLVSAFKGEIIEYSNVEAYYIGNPYTMGSLEHLKTIWSFTLTNDTSIPSELELCYATNKIPYESMKTLASISKDKLGFDFSGFNFSKIDFDKNVVPRTYTHKRILSGVKFVCFGFRNFNDSNSVLSSMTVTYTVPYPSYSGD